MRRTVPAITALSLGLALTLSGCFANPLDQLTEGLVEGGVEQIIEDQTGVDVDVDGTGASLPDSWPADVPTVGGTVQFSAATADIYTAAIETPSVAAGEAAYTDLLDAGFTQVAEFQVSDDASSRTFENSTWTVNVVVAANADGTGQVQYTITPITQ
ncbi:hypothetical protein [Microcella humidisoli]|jgi:hypothetical protein|uniref:Uncharacterized protein n=1 Tax=Microcella humidisoli TaxID=2963406 RepID=A0ABY5FZ49_9MICO|nr:hypothetical protein [Microcella humidisoli]UTT63412.1 hypothetical protein NNL39_04720 [Microcella humidisoli]